MKLVKTIKSQKGMKKLLLASMALMMAFGASAQQTNNEVNYVEVQGNAEREILPDEIFVQITINENDSKGKQTLADQEKEMFKVLKGLGVNTDKDLTVVDMSSDYRNFLLKKSDVMVAKNYKLKLSTAKQLAQVMQGLDKAGIANANVIGTNYSKMNELKAELRVEAIKLAKQKAEQLAAAIGQSIGQAIQINDFDNSMGVWFNDMRPMMMAKTAGGNVAAESTPNIDFEKTKVTYRVSARFLLNK